MKPTSWFGIIIIYTTLTMFFVYLIPSTSPLSVLKFIFGFTFVTFVPGYCLVNLLFREGKLDLIEKAVLSVALSFSITGVLGLFLGLSPLMITTPSLTISLSIIVVVLAFFAFLRKKRQQFQVQDTKQASS